MSSLILLHIHQHAAMSINSKGKIGKNETKEEKKNPRLYGKSDLDNDRGSVSKGQYEAATMSDGTNAVMKLL